MHKIANFPLVSRTCSSRQIRVRMGVCAYYCHEFAILIHLQEKRVLLSEQASLRRLLHTVKGASSLPTKCKVEKCGGIFCSFAVVLEILYSQRNVSFAKLKEVIQPENQVYILTFLYRISNAFQCLKIMAMLYQNNVTGRAFPQPDT